MGRESTCIKRRASRSIRRENSRRGYREGAGSAGEAGEPGPEGNGSEEGADDAVVGGGGVGLSLASSERLLGSSAGLSIATASRCFTSHRQMGHSSKPTIQSVQTQK